MYRYETHCHTAPVSFCASAPAEDEAIAGGPVPTEEPSPLPEPLPPEEGHSEAALEEFGELELVVEAIAFCYVPEGAVGREGEGIIGHVEL